MLKQISQIGPHSLGKLYGSVLGLMVAVFALPMGLIGFLSGDESAGFIVLIILFAPAIYFVLGYIAGGLFAVAYNFAARQLGGIEIELKDI